MPLQYRYMLARLLEDGVRRRVAEAKLGDLRLETLGVGVLELLEPARGPGRGACSCARRGEWSGEWRRGRGWHTVRGWGGGEWCSAHRARVGPSKVW